MKWKINKLFSFMLQNLNVSEKFKSISATLIFSIAKPINKKKSLHKKYRALCVFFSTFSPKKIKFH